MEETDSIGINNNRNELIQSRGMHLACPFFMKKTACDN